jgi:three-Cys-motif partner protein
VAKKAAKLKFDEIGYWSELKLEIIKKYAAAYSTILSAQTNPRLKHLYIDAFAGAGVHLSKKTGEFVSGSPLNALQVTPPFSEYHFIDLDSSKTQNLKELVGQRSDVQVYQGDCNQILLEKIFPHARYEQYRRALCLLDPYGLHLTWEVIKTAGQLKTIDMFLNFPVADMNRNVLWRNPEGVREEDIQRMTAFWGDDSWRSTAYLSHNDLFGVSIAEKEDNQKIADSFRARLKQVAGFKYVPQPLPMRNSRKAVVYYLVFASQKPVASKIVQDIFAAYQQYGST